MSVVAMRTSGMIAMITRDPAGFGMWRAGVAEYCWPDAHDRRHGDGDREIEAFVECSRGNGFAIEPTDELDGLVYDQRGQVYKFWFRDAHPDPSEEEIHYCQFWTEEIEDFEDEAE